MKFSVLLPTRNRLQFLEYAVETVRRQDYDDWEIVISDNCSEEDISGYVASLADIRVKYFRTDKFVPVTENWNNALQKSSGDYVIMLGDDDGLVNGYFKTMRLLIERYSEPDAVYTTGYIYAYPGVMPGWPRGFLTHTSSTGLGRATEPFFLDKKQATQIVRDSFRFRLRVGFNMQHSTLSRKFIDSLSSRGQFFQSVCPDCYATNVTFLRAERILVYPYPLVIIGISPKSHGFYYYNRRHSEGAEFLDVPRLLMDSKTSNKLLNVILPGDYLNTIWLAAMETIHANFGSEFSAQVDYRRYRSLQILYMLGNHYVRKTCPSEAYLEFADRIRPWERLVYGTGLLLAMLLERFLRIVRPFNLTKFLLRECEKVLGQGPKWVAQIYEGQFDDILDVFEQGKIGPLSPSQVVLVP